MEETLIEQYIKETGEFIATPIGTSMYPMLRHRRDTVYLVRYNGEGLKKYDLPVYKRTTGQQVMHRCLGKDENGYIMCGDNFISYNMNYEGKFGTVDPQEEGNALDNLFLKSEAPDLVDTDEALETPILVIDMEDLDKKTLARATDITEKLAAYYLKFGD